MSLTDRIRADLTEAMKARDAARLSTLRLVQAAFKNEQIEKGHALSDEEAEIVLRRAVKQRHDSVEQYRKGGREELAAKEEAEIAILEAYLPKMMTPEETERVVDDAIARTGAASKKDMGLVMKDIMTEHRGRVDGKLVQEILGRRLS